MTPEQEAAASHVVTHPQWRWLPGMRGVVPGRGGFARCIEPIAGTAPWQVYDCDGWTPADLIPDLNDPATLGGILALVRERWRDHRAYVDAANGEPWEVCSQGAEMYFSVGATEGEALIAALEETR